MALGSFPGAGASMVIDEGKLRLAVDVHTVVAFDVFVVTFASFLLLAMQMVN